MCRSAASSTCRGHDSDEISWPNRCSDVGTLQGFRLLFRFGKPIYIAYRTEGREEASPGETEPTKGFLGSPFHGGASNTMAKRPAASFNADLEEGRKKPRVTGWNKRHLYLVRDDWDKGYSIHKVDVGALGSDALTAARQLPDPLVLRVQAPADHRSTYFAAMGGSKLLIMHTLREEEEAPPAFVYDTATAALAIGPRPSRALRDGFHAAVTVAGKLYTLRLRRQGQPHSFEVLSRSPPRPYTDSRWSGKVEGWFWETVASPPPFDCNAFIEGYAVHPDGRTIFVSAERMTIVDRTEPGTYSFDTRACEWRRRGDWMLPFQGEGLYDARLNTWVGLRDDGFLCACDIPSCDDDGAASMTPAPNWRVGKDMVFRKLPRIAAEVALVAVDHGEYCVIELRPPEGVDMLAVGDDGRRVVHVSVFNLRYNEAGELQTTNHRRAMSFGVTKHDGCLMPKDSGCERLWLAMAQLLRAPAVWCQTEPFAQ